MNEMDKMKAYHAMETIKEAPDYMRNIQLLILCKTDPSGRMERIARILANYGIDSKKIVPCIMDIMEDFMFNEGPGDEDVSGQSDQVRQGTQEVLGRDEQAIREILL